MQQQYIAHLLDQMHGLTQVPIGGIGASISENNVPDVASSAPVPTTGLSPQCSVEQLKSLVECTDH